MGGEGFVKGVQASPSGCGWHDNSGASQVEKRGKNEKQIKNNEKTIATAKLTQQVTPASPNE